MIPMPENATLREPADGAVMIWIAKPGRAGSAVQAVKVFGRVNYNRFRVRKLNEGTYHTAQSDCLVWPKSLSAWSEILAKRPAVRNEVRETQKV